MTPALYLAFSYAAHQPYAHHPFRLDGDSIAEPRGMQIPKTNDGDLLQISRDNRTLTLTIKNLTKDSFPIYHIDYPITFLEAKKEGEWKPIERWDTRHCGNAVTYILLKPTDHASTTFTLFPGNFETEIRLCMYLYHNQITYSKPIKATINPAMFEFRAFRWTNHD
jgi:hypothetical protein